MRMPNSIVFFLMNSFKHGLFRWIIRDAARQYGIQTEAAVGGSRVCSDSITFRLKENKARIMYKRAFAFEIFAVTIPTTSSEHSEI